MKKINIIIGIVLLFIAFVVINSGAKKETMQAQKYPWQIKTLAEGKIQVFNVVLDETLLQDVDVILKRDPTLAIFESRDKTTLEAYYKSVPLGGLTGDFIFTLDVTEPELDKLKKTSQKQKRTEDNGRRYDLDKDASAAVKKFRVKNLIYIPIVQLDQDMVVKRFGEPTEKIQMNLSASEKKGPAVWHYLYSDKGLDVIISEEGKEVMQYVSPKEFNLLLEPLRQNQNQSH